MFIDGDFGHNPVTHCQLRGAPMTDHEKVQQLLRAKDQTPVTFDLRTSALVIVDVQRYFCRPDYPFARCSRSWCPA